MANANDLTTLANVKQYLGITTATDDAMLDRMITATSNYIESYINRQFKSRSYTDVSDGNNGDVCAFQNYPVTAVSSVQISSGYFGASYGNYNGGGVITIQPSVDGFSQGYVFDTKFLKLLGYRFARGRNNVHVTYTAGYATIPPEIEQACIELISLRYKEKNRIGEKSKSAGGQETVSYNIATFPESVKTILNNYKKVIPF